MSIKQTEDKQTEDKQTEDKQTEDKQTEDRRQETFRNDAAGAAFPGKAAADIPLRPDVALGLWMSWMETNFGKAQDWTGSARAASVKPESMLRSMPGCDSPFMEVDHGSGLFV